MERIPEFIGNNLFLVTLFVAIAILLIWNIFGSAITGIRQLLPREVTDLMNKEDAVVLDVRSKEDFGTGHIINAINIPGEEVTDRKDELKKKHKDRAIIACCGNGAVSTRIARQLRMEGFENVSCLKGGLQAWQNERLPVTKD